MSVITREQADAALACIRRQFSAYIDVEHSEPQLVESWEPFVYQDGEVVETEVVPFAILWEEGPDGWVYRVKTGGVDEELTLELRSVPGVAKTATVDTPAATSWPEGVQESPYFSWALCLYPE